jgi:4-hydroxybenzoate polyprenyltransferase
MRPFIWLFVLAIFVSGHILSRSPASPEMLVLGAISWVVMLNGATVVINAYYDQKLLSKYSDKVIADEELMRYLPYWSLILYFFGFMLALFINILFVILYLASAFLSFIYSAPPVRLKGRPWLDLITNAVGYGTMTFAAGWLLGGDFGLRGAFVTFGFTLAIAAAYPLSTIGDVKEDKASATKTLGVELGVKRARIIADLFALSAIAYVLALVVLGYLKTLTFLIMVPAAIIAYIEIRWFKAFRRAEGAIRVSSVKFMYLFSSMIIVFAEVLG